MSRHYDAIMLDLDGTLVDGEDRIHPRTLAALRAAAARGVVVMVATGRSELATRGVLGQLGFETPAIVFNGAAVYDPVREELVEQRVLGAATLERAVRFGERHELLTVAMCAGAKYATQPIGEAEISALRDMTGVTHVPRPELLGRRALRVTLFSGRHADSTQFAAELEQHLVDPVYITHFPLSCLPHHQQSAMLVCDVHPPCAGKAEGLRVLRERYGIPAARVVAVGDAGNDVPMLRAAGLGVAVGTAFRDALEAAARVIGAPDEGAIGALVEELFLGA